LDEPPLPLAIEELPDDPTAKRHACIIADEVNRNAKDPPPVLVFDEKGTLF
jgi:hypothetical protein